VVRVAKMVTAGEIDDEGRELLELLSEDDE
jgi:hypothetical protein